MGYWGPDTNDFNYDYEAQQTDYSPSDAWTNAIGSMGKSANRLDDASERYGTLMNKYTGMSQDLFNRGLDMMKPGGKFVTDSMNLYREDMDTSQATQMKNIGAMLAQQGVGGGIRNILNSGNKMGDELRRGRLGFQGQAIDAGNRLLGAGAQYGGVSSSYAGAQSSALGQAGQLRGQQANQYGAQDTNLMNVALANTQAQNTVGLANQSGNAAIEQANVDSSNAWKNQWLSAGAGVLGAAVGGPMGASLGAKMFSGNNASGAYGPNFGQSSYQPFNLGNNSINTGGYTPSNWGTPQLPSYDNWMNYNSGTGGK